ncbi:MAG: hypothetical protein ACIARQ_09075 [Phycisphaerales bacterium JB061]
MQILGPDEGALPALPETPILERYLFEAPMVPVALLVVIALIALLVGLRSSKPKGPVISALVMLVLAAGVYITAGQVTTDREVITERTAELIGAIAESDVQAMRSTMAESVRLGHSDNASSVATRVPRLTGRDRIESTVNTVLGEQGSPQRLVGSHQILETRAGLDGKNTGRTLVRVRVRGPGDAFVNHSWWEVTWKRIDSVWQATRVEAIWIQG